jgi:hypothetical protein
LNFTQDPSPHSSLVTHLCPPVIRGWRGTVSVADINFSSRPYKRRGEREYARGGEEGEARRVGRAEERKGEEREREDHG